jgi:hypothetical protein
MDRRGDSFIMNDGNASDRSHHAILPLDVLDQIDRICDRYEAVWQAGGRPRAEDYLDAIAAPYRSSLLHDLLAAELDARRRCGESPEPREYHGRFPEHMALIGSLFTAPQEAAIFLPAARSPMVDQTREFPRDSDRTEVVASPSPWRSCPDIPGFEVIGELGRRGMGVVYRARRTLLNRPCALKMILAGDHAGPEATARFLAEAETVAQLSHPTIVQIYSIGDQGGRPYVELEYIDGGTLADQVPRLLEDPPTAVSLLHKVARAVHHAHQHGILHRDLKPANILLDADNQPHVTDFGLAKRIEGASALTHTGEILGTPSFMAPEQATGKQPITTAADVYSLGAILYVLLTGRPPFQAETPWETLQQVIEREPVRPRALNARADRDLELICLKCLAKDPLQRHGSADALAADLEHWLAGEPISVRPPALTTLVRFWLRQNFGAASWTAVLGLVWGLLIGVACWLAVINPFLLSRASEGYARLPASDPPWLASAWRMPHGMRNATYFVAVGISGTMGLFIVLLVRPKSRRADLAAGTITGLVAAVAAFVTSFGWLAVTLTTVAPADSDLRLLAEAAWAETTLDAGPSRTGARAGTRPVDRLSERYLDLDRIPVSDRGRVLYDKIVTDLTTRIPIGIWLGMLFAIGLGGSLSVCETLVAGVLLRRHGRVSVMIWSYLELAGSASVLVMMVFGAVFGLYVGRFNGRIWHLLAFALLVLAIIAVLRGWHWLIRAAMHAGWLISFAMIGKSKGIF